MSAPVQKPVKHSNVPVWARRHNTGNKQVVFSHMLRTSCVGCRDGSKPFGWQVKVCFCAVITPPRETSQSRMGAAGGGQEWGAGLKNNIFYKYFIWWHPNKFSCTPFSRLCSSDAMQHPSFIIHSSQRILSIYMNSFFLLFSNASASTSLSSQTNYSCSFQIAKVIRIYFLICILPYIR